MAQTVENLWPTVMTGGAITYSRPELKNLEFEGEPFAGVPEEDNILIAGAGPNGLYMAAMLRQALPKKKFPKLHINVVESRVSPEGRRKITRSQEIGLATHYLKEPAILEEIEEISEDLYETLHDFKESAPRVFESTLDFAQAIKVNDEMLQKFSSSGSERFMKHRTYRTNVLEYELAHYAQSLGVNIYHDASVRDPATLISKYTNAQTLVLFDATGGRLFGFDPSKGFKKIRTSEPFQQQIFANALAHVGSFDVYEGFLPPEDSVKMLGELLYVAIGDTTFRVDYFFGRGIAISWSLSFFYALQFTKYYKIYSTVVGGGKRRRQTRRQKLRSSTRRRGRFA